MREQLALKFEREESSQVTQTISGGQKRDIVKAIQEMLLANIGTRGEEEKTDA